ncbi:MAG: hypothetical protein KIS66_05330 [Fimbriimonadaceae bacterium]|nr:hypothetical protein [Fimbriimonadaceae bacterium]
MRKTIALLPAALLAFLFVLTGCGGSGGDAGGGNAAAYAGTYTCGYNRASGTMLINVTGAGTINIVVNDDTKGPFVGTGTVNANNGFSVDCANTAVPPEHVTVVGTLAGSGAGRTAAGTVAGAFTIAYTATFAADANHSVFAAHYEGYFQGADSGTWTGDVDSSGRFTGTAHSNAAGNFTVTGQLTATGAATITGTVTGGAGTATFSGRFFLVTGGIHCGGTWTSSAGNGQWFGGNSNEG